MITEGIFCCEPFAWRLLTWSLRYSGDKGLHRAPMKSAHIPQWRGAIPLDTNTTKPIRPLCVLPLVASGHATVFGQSRLTRAVILFRLERGKGSSSLCGLNIRE